MVGLYEQAQACPMVLPRLYLLNTVGACYILSKEAPARVRKTNNRQTDKKYTAQLEMFSRPILAHFAKAYQVWIMTSKPKLQTR